MNRRDIIPRKAAAMLLVFAATHGAALAADDTDPYEKFRSPSDSNADFDFDDSHIKPWKEGAAGIPVLSLDGLNEIDIDHGPPGLNFKIDMETLSVGEQDGVVRYWVVTESGGRRTNVIYEGIHCAESTYKVYAYASPQRTSRIKPVSDPEWILIREGRNDYHFELMNAYFCWKGSPQTLIGIRNALRGSFNLESQFAEDTDFIRR
jgi:hypothetical protein